MQNTAITLFTAQKAAISACCSILLIREVHEAIGNLKDEDDVVLNARRRRMKAKTG
jgi:hypothetical protein